MHLFSGSLKREATRHCVTLDKRYEPTAGVVPGIQADALKLPFVARSFDLIYADTPYSSEDAKRYGLPLPNRQFVLRECYRVVEPGGFLVWMDTVLPMYSKTQWKWVGAIPMFRSTNHRVRAVMIFERQ
jgi:ubiquinone/menaquinone biosynthesis C-methylase UbiE